MAKIDIISTWETCKSLIQQAQHYINSSVRQGCTLCCLDISGDNATTAYVPTEIVNALKTEFQKIIEFIEIFLLQDNDGAYYGSIMIQTEYNICVNQRGFLDFEIKNQPMKFKFNPFLTFEKNTNNFYSINEIIGSTVLEICKLIFLHPTTFAKLNRNKDSKIHDDLEIGSSVSASELVLNDIKLEKTKNRLKLNNNIYRLSDLIEETDGNIGRNIKHTEGMEYYYKIAETYRKTNKKAGSGGGSSQIGEMNPDGTSNIHQWEDIKNIEDTEDDVKQIIKTAFDSLSDKQRGNLPSSITEQIEMLFKKPELNWKDILRRYVGIIPSGHRPSRLRLNRRQPERFDLCGTMSSKVVRLVIGIDTSGSMSDSDIAYCMNEIYNIIKGYKTEITVIECDCEIGRVYTVKSPKDIKTNVTGRGGTEFGPVIEYINNHRFRDAVMIYFTDGYGESRIDRPRTYRNLWVIRGNEPCISLENPYGEVKCLKGDADYTSLYH